MFKIDMEEGGILFEFCLAGLVILMWMLILGWTSILAQVLTGGDYPIIIQSVSLSLAMLWYGRWRIK